LLSLAACGSSGGGPPSGTLPLIGKAADAAAAAVLYSGEAISGIADGAVEIIDRLDQSEEGTFNCPEGGTYTIDLNGNPPTGGTMTLNGCKVDFDGDLATLNGTIDFRFVDNDTMALVFDMTATEDGDTTAIEGDMTVRWRFGGGATAVQTVWGDELSLSEDGFTLTFEKYRFEETTDLNTDDWTATMRGYLRTNEVAGSVYFETLERLAGPEDDHPTAGVVIVRGLAGTRVRITLMGEDILLEYDEDGDGTYEDDETITWDDLD